MPFFFRRFAEYFAVEMLASVLCTCFLLTAVEKTTASITLVVMLLCITINIIHLFGCLKEYWHCVYDKWVYYRVNISVFIAFAVLNLTMANKNLEPIYTYLFFPYKILTLFEVDKVTSAIVVNAVMLFFIIIVPFIAKPRGKERFRGY